MAVNDVEIHHGDHFGNHSDHFGLKSAVAQLPKMDYSQNGKVTGSGKTYNNDQNIK